MSSLSARHFAHLVHGEPSANLATDLVLARVRRAGMIYVTDDVLVPNTWDTLATYWTTGLELLAIP